MTISKFLKKIVPIKLKTKIRNYQLYLNEFGFFWKPKLIFRLYNTKKREDLNRYKILEPEYQWILNGIALTHEASFLKDKRFLNSYEKGVENQIKKVFGHPNDYIIWRAQIATWFVSQTLPNQGDFVECGVWYGWMSKTIIEYLDFEKLSRKFYLIDYWNMSESPSDIEENSHKSYYDPLSQESINQSINQGSSKQSLFNYVKQRFRYRNVELIQGWIPDVFSQKNFPKIDKVAYLHIDLNGNDTELHVLNYFYPKLVQGGIIIFDDYGHGYKDLVETVDAFFSDKPEKLFYFACGSAVVVKQ